MAVQHLVNANSGAQCSCFSAMPHCECASNTVCVRTVHSASVRLKAQTEVELVVGVDVTPKRVSSMVDFILEVLESSVFWGSERGAWPDILMSRHNKSDRV